MFRKRTHYSSLSSMAQIILNINIVETGIPPYWTGVDHEKKTVEKLFHCNFYCQSALNKLAKICPGSVQLALGITTDLPAPTVIPTVDCCAHSCFFYHSRAAGLRNCEEINISRLLKTGEKHRKPDALEMLIARPKCC